MKNSHGPQNNHSSLETTGITRIAVAGYKSISREQSVEIRPLTILAGTNSSGKSSIMQPLLLLKQTLEAIYDPGTLLLDGPNVKFTSAGQLLSRDGKGKAAKSFNVSIEVYSEGAFARNGTRFRDSTLDTSIKDAQSKATFTIHFGKDSIRGFDVRRMDYSDRNTTISLRRGMPEKDIFALLPKAMREEWKILHGAAQAQMGLKVIRDRCFLRMQPEFVLLPIESVLAPLIHEVIHLPGLRGNPQRTYPVTAIGSAFSGTFDNYIASVIAQWQANKRGGRIERLSKDLEKLGLTWKVTAISINDTQVEIQVGRLISSVRSQARDLVNIADVGFGVSQTLPVLVALQAAEPGQLVYLEQPEIHLHPRAQTAMAQVLADAAKRGVRVVAETHSSLLLLGIQTLVAEGELSPELIKLHWFSRRDDGSTMIQSADLDEAGAFGDWPEDFAEVELAAESRYLDAAEARQQVH
ncbi:MAG: hypothetical protein JMDDDDMK_05143 [Acidobacteria bacterium]|nr:hypothetical protein [Acidobacteriota bacterium]